MHISYKKQFLQTCLSHIPKQATQFRSLNDVNATDTLCVKIVMVTVCYIWYSVSKLDIDYLTNNNPNVNRYQSTPILYTLAYLLRLYSILNYLTFENCYHVFRNVDVRSCNLIDQLQSIGIWIFVVTAKFVKWHGRMRSLIEFIDCSLSQRIWQTRVILSGVQKSNHNSQ